MIWNDKNVHDIIFRLFKWEGLYGQILFRVHLCCRRDKKKKKILSSLVKFFFFLNDMIKNPPEALVIMMLLRTIEALFFLHLTFLEISLMSKAFDLCLFID